MRIRHLAAPAAVAAAGAAFLIAGPDAEAGKVKTVSVGSYYYAPAKLTVKAGDKVRFAWEPGGFEVHDVGVQKGPRKFRSPLQAAGTWSKKLKKPGRYVLVCSQHANMSMTITVKKRR